MSNPCSTIAVSYAWVSPTGKVHECGQGGHAGWAEDYVGAHPDLRVGDDTVDDLLFHGWIKVGNFTTMAVWNEGTPSRQAWGAVVDLLRECLLERNVKVDPFDAIMFLDSIEGGSQAKVYSISDFVEKFGGRRESEALFDGLMGKKAADTYFQPGDLILSGKFQNKPGQITSIFKDERGIPMVEIAPVGHPRRKTRTMSLYRIRHADPAKRVASAWAMQAMEHATQEALDKHLKEHPGADPKDHWVKKQEGGGEQEDKATHSRFSFGEKLDGYRPPEDAPEFDGGSKEWVEENTIRTPGGSLIMGTPHAGEGEAADKFHKEQLAPAVHKVIREALAAGKKVVFLAEGGVGGPGGDDSEQTQASKAIKKEFGKKVKQDTFDDDGVRFDKEVRNEEKSDDKNEVTDLAFDEGAPAAKKLIEHFKDPALVEAGLFGAMWDQMAEQDPEMENPFKLSPAARKVFEKKGIDFDDPKSLKKMWEDDDLADVGEANARIRDERMARKVREVEEAGEVAVAIPGAQHAYMLKHVLEGKKSGKSGSRVASAYLSRVALEFDTKEEMEEYRKTRDVRKDTKLTVKKKEEGGGSSKAEPSSDAQAVGQKIMTGIKRPSGWRDPKDEQTLTAETRKEWEGEHTARTANGSVVLGVTHMDATDDDSGAKSHSDATESASFKEHVLKEVDKAVKAAIKAGKKVVFLGEGGATSGQPYDEETLDDPNDWNEQHAVAKAVREATGGKAKQGTWDDGPVDITKPDAEVWGRLTKAAGGNAVKAKGALAVFMAGQGDTYEGMKEQGWMNDEVADEVERATGIDLREDVSAENKAKMYRMAFPGDTKEPHNEVSAIGEVYNAARQEHLLSKIKEIESDPDGAVAIVAPGAGHAYQLKHALEGGKAGKSAGSLVQFPTRAAPPPVRPKHTVTIGGRKYALSADGGPLGDQLVNELAGEGDDGGARVVDMPYFKKPEPYRFLWVYDTEEGTVLMWRVTDGNNKVWGPADDFASKVWDLDKKGEMNRVTHTEMQKVDRAMRKREAEQLRSLKKWNADNASDYQKLVDEVAWDVFNRDVKPKLESRLREVKRGVTPIHFKVQEDQLEYRPLGDQVQAYVLGEEMQKFTVEKIEDEVRSSGVDPDAPGHDIQAAYWAHGDVTQAVWEKYRKSSASRVATQWLFAKRTKLGDCYEAAAKYVMANGMLGKRKDLVLVHGEVMGQGPLEGTTFGHAWVLDGGTVIDVSNGGKLRMPKSVYYAIGRIDEIGNTHEYTVEEARSHLLRYKTYGPWELKTRSGL